MQGGQAGRRKADARTRQGGPLGEHLLKRGRVSRWLLSRLASAKAGNESPVKLARKRASIDQRTSPCQPSAALEAGQHLLWQCTSTLLRFMFMVTFQPLEFVRLVHKAGSPRQYDKLQRRGRDSAQSSPVDTAHNNAFAACPELLPARPWRTTWRRPAHSRTFQCIYPSDGIQAAEIQVD